MVFLFYISKSKGTAGRRYYNISNEKNSLKAIENSVV
jgi:hypothetical protein